MNESRIWTNDDKHKIAYLVLRGDLARSMGERLGIVATESTTCTNCHGTNVPDADEVAPFVREENGVSCIACHGPYLEWVLKHEFPDVTKWGRYTRREREELFGMYDLWDPAARALKCASCHIGNAAEGKVLTHAMFQAGHPPLPSLEVATFSEAQPRHWQYLREKEPAVQALLGYNPGKREQTELVVVSALVALRETMKLFASQADPSTISPQRAEPQWPDFARFACGSCHHQLGSASWRRARGPTPACPPTPAWPHILVPLILATDPTGKNGLAAEYMHSLAVFQSAMEARPYGDRVRAVAAARGLIAWAEATIATLDGVSADPRRIVIDRPMAIRMLHQLCKSATSFTLDYDSARQVYWAFRTIYQETKAMDPESLPDPAIAEILDRLGQSSRLSLFSPGVQTRISDTLPAQLAAFADYDPAQVQSKFAEIATHLPRPY